MTDRYKNKYCLINEQLVAEEQVHGLLKRPYLIFEDCIYDTIRALGSELSLAGMHLEYLKQCAEIAGITLAENISTGWLQHQAGRLLRKNKYFKGAALTLVFWKAEDPENTSWLMQARALEEEKYSLNKKGMKLGLFREIRLPVHILSILRPSHAYALGKARAYMNSGELDDCILLNERFRPIESTRGALFFIRGSGLYTPAQSEGCIPSVIREIILARASEAGLTAYQGQLETRDLLQAEECFVANSTEGIQWVVAFEQKRYFNSKCKRLLEEVNRTVFN